MNNGLPEKIVPVYGEESQPFVLPAGPSCIALKIPEAKSITSLPPFEFTVPNPVFSPSAAGKLPL